MVDCLALPDRDDVPSRPLKGGPVPGVARFGATELRQPVINVLLRLAAQRASVLVPEAPVHENDSFVSMQDDVRASWQIGLVQAKSEPHAVKDRSDDPFRLSVRLADTLHDAPPHLLVHRRKVSWYATTR